MRVCLHTIFLLFLSFFCNAQQDNSDLIDSFERVIKKETNDSTKVWHIIRYISRAPLKDDKKILSFFEKGKRLCRHVDDRNILYQLYITTSNKLSIIGYKDLARKKAEEVLELTTPSQDILIKYYSKAQLELARFDTEEGNKESALIRVNDIISANNKIGPSSELSLAYNEKTIYYRNAGDLDRALACSDSAISVAKILESDYDLGNLYSGRGRIHRALGDNEKAKADYLKAKDFAEENKLSKTLGVAYNNLGNIEHIAGNYDEAIAYYMKSLEIKEKENDIRGKAIAFHNIAAIKFDMKDWDGAIQGFRKSNELADSIKFTVLTIYSDLKVGNIYYEQELYDQALEIHSEVLDLSKEIEFKYGEISGHYRVGQDQLQLGQYQEASLSLLEALELSEKHGNKPLEASVLISLSELYMQTQEGLIQAESSKVLSNIDIENLLLRAKTMSDDMNIATNKLDVLSSLHNYYLTNNNYRKDAAILNEYVLLKDSLFSSEMAESVADWQTKYKTAEQQKEIVELEAANKIEALKSSQFKGLLIGAIAFFSLLFFFGYNYLRQETKKKQAKQRELFRSKLSSDLHDDVGSILTGLAMQSELLSNFADHNIKGSMEKLAHMSRDAMSRMRDTVWAIDSRKDSYDDLVDRMLDFGNDVLLPKDIQLNMDVVLDTSKEKIEPVLRQNLYLIFKEAITNAAKYSSGNKVNVKLAQERNIVIMLIQDNGDVDPSQVRTSGTGTSNIIKRAEDLSGEADISYDQSGYRLEVMIPFK